MTNQNDAALEAIREVIKRSYSHTETYEEKIKRLPKVLEAYAADAQKDCYWKGDSGLAPALQSAADCIRQNITQPKEGGDE